MKKLAFLALCLGTLTFASCNNNPKNETAGERLDNEIDTLNYNVAVAEEKAKAKVDQAQNDLNAAIERGDKKAEEISRKTLEEARVAWQKTKNLANEAARDVRDVANETKEAARKAVDSADRKAERVRDAIKN